MYRVGIDLGGTNIAVGVIDNDYNFLGKSKVKTNAPRPAEEICDDIAKAVNLALEDAEISLDDVEMIGIGAPGSIDPITGTIGFSNNLGFQNVKFVEMLELRIGKKIIIDNDANAAAAGEFLCGAGKDVNSIVAITLGTGVGSGIIINGKMLLGSNFAGGELGHTVIVKDGEQCTCGRRGCWESYASATGLINLTKRAMQSDKNSKMWEICGNDINNVDGLTSFDAMRAGDKSGTDVVDEYCSYLATGLVNVINIFQPDIICLGGGVSKEGDNILNRINPIIEKEIFSKNISKQTEIKIAELGNNAGIIGAAMLDKIYNN